MSYRFGFREIEYGITPPLNSNFCQIGINALSHRPIHSYFCNFVLKSPDSRIGTLWLAVTYKKTDAKSPFGINNIHQINQC